MAGPIATRRRVAAVSLAALALAAGACSKDEHVMFFNGFDFPVVATVTAEGGETTTLELAPRSRAGASVTGKATVRVATAGGDLVAERQASFPEEPKKGCVHVFNIEGGAAVEVQDVAYGTAFGAPGRSVLAGEISDPRCDVRWLFEDPPEAVTVEKYTPGVSHGWMHYTGDGGWLAAAEALLTLDDRWPEQRRGAAYRIVGVVVKHDPNNPRLADAKALFDKHGVRMPTVEALAEQAARQEKEKARRAEREARRKQAGK